MNSNIYKYIENYTVKPLPYKIAIVVVIILCSFSFIARWNMTEKTPIQMDEFYDTQAACQLAKGQSLYREGGYYFRTPFIAHFSSKLCEGEESSLVPIMSGRKFMWAFSLIILLLVYLVSQRVYGSSIAIFAPLILCSFTTFMDHSIHVRPDLVGTLLCCGALFLATFNSGWLYLGSGTMLGLAAMTTQKSLYPIIAFAFAVTIRHVLESKSLSQFTKAIVKSLGASGAGFFLLLTVYLSLLSVNENISRFFHQTIFDAADAGLFSHVYSWTWSYLIMSIQRNPVVWGLGLVGIVWAVRFGFQARSVPGEYKRQYALLAMMGIWGIVQFAFTLKHNMKFPYFFINISPILSICATGVVGWLFHKTFLTEHRSIAFGFSLKGIFIALALVGLLKYPYDRHVHNLTTGNLHLQKAVVSRLDLLTNVDDAIFDGLGLATTRKKATPYSLTNRFYSRKNRDDYDIDIIDWLRRTEPKAFVVSYRFDRLNAEEISFLANHFLHDWANIWVAGVTVQASKDDITTRNVDLITSAEYAVVCDDLSNVWMDGKQAQQVMYLEAGSHTLDFKGSNSSVALKYAPAVQKPPPYPQRSRYKLFMGFSEL